MIFQATLISFLIISVWPGYNPVQAIVSGQRAFPGEFPHQVSLHNGKPLRLSCGGTLIHPQWVLTAAHCPVNSATIIKAGKNNIHVTESTEQTATVTYFIKHPSFSVASLSPYDVALIKVAQPFRLNRYVKVIGLPQRGVEPVGTAVLSGWGSVSRTLTPSMPSVLQKATLNLQTAGTCVLNMRQSYPRAATSIYDMNVCTDSRSGSCGGDSGGPLIGINPRGVYEVIGVVGWGLRPCGISPLSVFTKVSYFIDWIQYQMTHY